MAEIRKPIPVQPFCGIIYGSDAVFDVAIEMLEKKFGAIDFRSIVFDFSGTGFYKKEMGDGLKKIFVAYENLCEPIALADAKIATNEIEDLITAEHPGAGSGRTVNLDPGYINEARMILATTKDYQHRICIGEGIYAEITLKYNDGSYSPNDWTYPDYRTPAYISFFNELRCHYRNKLGRASAPANNRE